MYPVAIFFLLCLTGQEVLGARILGLFPAPGKSHLWVTSPVMHALAKKGHDVTMFVPFPTGFNASNYREIIFPHTPPPALDQELLLKFNKMNFVVRQSMFYYVGLWMTENALNTTEARALIRSEEKFDLVVMENFMSEAFFAFAHKFKCPTVLISTFGTPSEINNIFGNSAPYSYVPSDFSGFSDRMTFFERLRNTITTLFNDISRYYYYMPRQQALAVKYFSEAGITLPPLDELERQTDFILINSHDAFSTPRPYMSNMKNVAGIHIKPPKPLPSDLQQYLDSSENGVVLLSFGSGVESAKLPDHILQAFKTALGTLPYNVLWKWENDTMANKPKNVRIGKWLPQSDILAHPNLKLFVTHGGMSSSIETVYHEVPIVGIPVMGDQKRNIVFAQSKGYAESLNIETITADELYNAIMKVTTNPEYRENVKKVSAYWKDEMNHPLDTAVHWVEYVLRHGGAKHLKAAVTEQNFIQYLLIDVAFTILLGLVLIYFLIRGIFKLLCKKSTPGQNAKKTN